MRVITLMLPDPPRCNRMVTSAAKEGNGGGCTEGELLVCLLRARDQAAVIGRRPGS